jgi:hypothetical protein
MSGGGWRECWPGRRDWGCENREANGEIFVIQKENQWLKRSKR